MKTNHNKLAVSLSHSHITSSTQRPPNRPALKMVASTYQPPEQTQATSSYARTQKKSEASLQLKYKQSHREIESQFQSQYSYSSNFNPSVQFITSLVSLKQMTNFDEGDCIPIDTDDRWIIITGEVKVVGINSGSFNAKEGFIFFASPETKRKVKQIVVVSPTTAFKIPQVLFKQNIRNYLYIKNAQKIKFLQYCPFLTWNQSLSEDMAIVMDSVQPKDKDVMIYKDGDESDYLYFVKEGIVLLERLGKTCNQIILDFEKHYEASYLSEEEGLIIVRKGMIFGVDGILIKEINKQINLLETQNPEHLQNDENQVYAEKQYRLKTTRIYTAKSIGKCQLYRIDKNVLETYLKSHGGGSKQQQHISNKQLDRICIQYTNLLMGSNRACKEVKKKNFQFDISKDQAQMETKRKKVQEIKLQEKKMKKIPHNSEPKKYEHQQPEQFPMLERSPSRKKKGSETKSKDVSLPSLNKKYVQSLIFKKIQAKQAQKYMGYKKKIQAALLGKQLDIPNPKTKKENNKAENAQFMKVKSYRSLLSSLG